MEPKADPVIALTTGEPAGIGPDVVLGIAKRILPCALVVFADRHLLEERAKQLRQTIRLIDYSDQQPPSTHQPHTLCVRHIPLKTQNRPQQLKVENVPYVLETLTLATKACLSGEMHALVTGPVHKGVINQAGILFRGQTDYLQGITHAKHVVMSFIHPRFKIGLATTHIPLAEVPKALTFDTLTDTILTSHHALQQKFGITHPRMGICGLNPHAGEMGYLGNEEIDTIQPVIQQLKERGIDLEGPLPADTAFLPEHRHRYDFILTMYHDQGLPVMKALDFQQTVNLTLGLPIIRTSVDHGTALPLAGTGKVDSESCFSALSLAYQLAKAMDIYHGISKTT